MATSYGFFNSKNSDRVYSAEDFNEYLSGLICNGVFGNYGESFKVTSSGDLTVTVGTGKAWINGHYFVSDTPYVVDLSSHVKAASVVNVLIGISCNTAENARMCKFEISAVSGIGTESHPIFSETETKKYLTIAEIRLSAGATSVSQSNITDYRDDESKCGYVKCILGKCHVSEILAKLDDYNKTVTELNERVKNLQDRLTEVEEVTGATGVVLDSSGRCGLTAYYALYSNGSLKLTGTAATFSYNDDNPSPFYQNKKVKNVSVESGITKIGNNTFFKCTELESVTLPNTLTEICEYAFAGAEYSTSPGLVYGVKNINIPNSVKTIGDYAFMYTRLTEITIPSSVETIGKYVFDDCADLETVRIESQVMGNFMFPRCSRLSSLTISKNCKKLGNYMLAYCENLKTITYEGTIAQWELIEKSAYWICSDKNNDKIYHNGYLQEIKCTDGSLIWSNGKFVLLA